MKYNTSIPLQKTEFLSRAAYLAEKGKMVELTELRPLARRTQNQNNCFWSWCSLMAEIIGERDVESVARDVKRRILGVKKVKNVFTGKETFEDYHTHMMSDEEMSDFLTQVKQWAFSTYGWALPSKGDIGYEEMMMQYGRR